ncbi:THO complex subunit 1-like isoform X1 [Acropora muricata]|uniref:THO complex subunit 1-like isoform X1 n=1 Tax=Acropora muricata TaxID=159855 RepID=UPI0034E51C2E
MADKETVDFKTAATRFGLCISKAKNVEDIADLTSVFQATPGSEQEKKLIVDQVFRDLVKEDVLTAKNMERCKFLISLVTKSAIDGHCSPNLVFILLSDVFDCITLEQCDPLFTFVEERVSIWTMPLFFSAGKNLLLRMCNDLLRRLSTSQNTIFCGRIQLFLARLFPLSEKSGLNLMSHFNYENVTIFTQRPATDQKDKNCSTVSEMEVDDKVAKELTSSNVPIDFNLYKKFWALQDYFRNPTQCYNNAAWKTFTDCNKEVLNVFKSHKLEHITWKKKSGNAKALDGSKDEPRYFAKFLTNEKLLDLQLSDSNFRRTILVQILIIYQYLVGNVKFKSTNQVLNESQSAWVKEMTSQVYELLKETPPDGDKFAKAVEHILEREENWISWKNEGCPSFIKERIESDPKPTPTSRKRKASIGDEVASGWRSKRVVMGSNELTRLWNLCPDNLEACKADNRVFLPSLEEYFSEAIEQADPEAMVEDEYKVIKNSNYGWRALRLLARRSHHFFQPSTNPFKTLPDYLDSVVQQLAQELPNLKNEESIVVNGTAEPSVPLPLA